MLDHLEPGSDARAILAHSETLEYIESLPTLLSEDESP